ncbi:uncharacterized protein LOC116558920 [Sapajus apella]|uniref:Uncharacterized protein LOC116558920 n=1 Tax=Sapajus apella TaxID=9515 RepID=A0A6J3IRK5_SAPAP|nr:uncharacterized protein LOC116558920 [Sapajus apella]
MELAYKESSLVERPEVSAVTGVAVRPLNFQLQASLRWPKGAESKVESPLPLEAGGGLTRKFLCQPGSRTGQRRRRRGAALEPPPPRRFAAALGNLDRGGAGLPS